LCELGLVQKQSAGGRYLLTSEVKIGVLRHFVKLGRLLFPRYFFYAIFSTTFYIIYLTMLMHGFSPENLFIAFFGAIISAILEGKLSDVEMQKDPIFKINVPTTCEGVPQDILTPRNTWKDGNAYDDKARNLAGMFRKNFKEFEFNVSRDIKQAGPKG